MRYQLDRYDDVEKSMVFWIGKYVKHKINTLSHAKTTNAQEIQEAIKFLNTEPSNIEDIGDVVKRIRRKANFDGVKTFYLPVSKLYAYLDTQPIKSLKDIDDDYIVDFLTSSTATYADATKVSYRNAIVNFFIYLSNHNENKNDSGNGYIYHLNLGQWQGLSGKSGKKIYVYLTEKELNLFIGSLDTYPFRTDRTALFYNLIIRVIAFTGVRVSEAISIKRDKIETKVIGTTSYTTFHIHGKGNYQRLIYVKSDLIEPYLSQWINTFSPCPDNFLFCAPSSAKKLANASAISTKVKQLLSHTGIVKDKRGAHILRHTFATILYDKTKDLVLLQELLGHEDPNTTKIYTHISEDRIIAASSAFDELNKKKYENIL